MTSKSARLAERLLLLASASLPARLAASVADTEPPIIVTGARPDPSPATSEGIDAARINQTVNAVNVEDMLRYLPSLLVRKRHVGDTQAPLATRTSGVGASARSLIYVDGVLLSALIGNNNSFASPRWGLVSPEEVDRIEILYGPYSAAYPGNSIGAVVNFTTRLPDRSTGSIEGQTEVQSFDQYATHGTYPVGRLATTWGDRSGPVSWFVSANHVSSHSQPLAYVTVARPAGTSAAGTPVIGAYDDLNRTGAPIFVLGAGGFEDQDQDNVALHLAVDLGPRIRLSYRGAVFLNDTESHAETYLRSAAGTPVYAGNLNIEGRSVSVPASAFSNNVYTLDERHFMHALTLDAEALGMDWRAIGSLYDFDRDVQRLPSGALPGAGAGGGGSIARLDGTGWRTFDLAARRHGSDGAAHDLSFGLHGDRFELASNRYATTDWRHGDAGALAQASRGDTRTLAVWGQDLWTLGGGFELMLGGRYEWWRAYGGFNFSASPALSVSQPELRREGFSPKASLRWIGGQGWRVALAAGQAYRFPTVSELYQSITTGATLSVPNPNLQPERARSEELAIERNFGNGHVRLSLFNEAIRNALISQSAPLVAGSTSLFNYVQNIPHVRTRGIELAMDWHDLSFRGFDLSGSFTLADPKTIDDPIFPAAEGKDLPQVPRRRATLVATYRVTPSLSFTVAGRYSSRSFATIDNSDPVTHTYQGFEEYFVLDARMTYRFGPHLEFAAGVENLNNDRYFLFHPFPQRSVNAEISYRW